MGLLDCKLFDTLIIQNHGLGEYLDQVPVDKGNHQILVGKLIFISHSSRHRLCSERSELVYAQPKRRPYECVDLNSSIFEVVTGKKESCF